MSFSSLLGQYATQKSQPQQEKTVREPVSYVTFRNIQSKFQSKPVETRLDTKETHLCILFIIIDDFPLEHIWRLWLDNFPESSDKVDVFFHAKYPDRVKSRWVRHRLVQQFHYSPTWGSVDIAKVMLFMLKEVSENCPHINKFVFASESCIPIQSLEATIGSINGTSHTSSWVNWHDKSQCNGYSVGPQFEAMTASFPPEYIYKADQWCLLSRYHVEQILALKDAFDAEHLKLTNHNRGFTHMFTPGKATDELLIPCALALVGHIKGKNTSSSSSSSGAASAQEGQVLVRRSTYCDWSAREKRPQSFTPTASYLVPPDHLKAAKAEGCLFLRKIALPEGGMGVISEILLRQWLLIVFGDKTIDDRVQNALRLIEQFKSEDTALELKDVRHLVGVFNNFERNTGSGSSSSADNEPNVSRFTRPQGKWDGHRNNEVDNKRKYEDRPREQQDQRSWHRPYQR